MLAFLTRNRHKESVMSETASADTDPSVVMRFLTLGGATVELHRQDRTVNYLPGRPAHLMHDGATRVSNGFNWRCLGCGSIGGGGRYGLGDRHFDEYAPRESRVEANDHAATCRAMPRPEAAR